MSVKAKVRIGTLNSVGGVLNEMAKVYREGRRGELELSDATKLVMILREIRCALEVSEFEARLLTLEQKK